MRWGGTLDGQDVNTIKGERDSRRARRFNVSEMNRIQRSAEQADTETRRHSVRESIGATERGALACHGDLAPYRLEQGVDSLARCR